MQFKNFILSPDWDQDRRDTYKRFYDSIWNDLEYLQFGLKINKGDTVVDCGASIGLFTNFAANKDASKIIAIEASKDVYPYLKKNTLDASITAVNGVVGPVGASYQVGDFECAEEIYDLQRIFNDFNLEKINFLKVDIENAEFGLFLTASDDLLSRIDQIAMEMHFCGPEQLRIIFEYDWGFQIIDKLSANGFVVNCKKIHLDTCCYNLYAKRI